MSYDSQEEYEHYMSLEADAEAEMQNQQIAEEQMEEERDATMNTDGIMKIERVDISDVNAKLENGWRLLYVGMEADTGYPHDGDLCASTIAVVGLPRQQPCGAESFGHVTPKMYDHEKGAWYCVDCRKSAQEPDQTVPF